MHWRWTKNGEDIILVDPSNDSVNLSHRTETITEDRVLSGG